MTEPGKFLTHYQPQVKINLDQVVTLDFETYWDSKTFTLKKLSMEAYVRDPRFLVHGVGYRVGDKPPRWVAGDANVRKVLQALPLDRCVVVCHNAAFDGLILSEIYDVHPKALICTHDMAAMIHGNNLSYLSLAALTKRFLPGQKKDQGILFQTDGRRRLNDTELEAMGEYCIGDVEKTWALFKLFLPLLEQSPLNLDTIDLVNRMFTEPTLLMREDILADLVANEVVEKQLALDGCVAENLKQLNSNQKLATLLESLGVDPPMKISGTTGNETFAMAKDDRQFQALLRHDDHRVRDLVSARLRCKSSINETRAKKYLEVACRGAWPVHLYTSGARTTHRLSGGPGGGGNPQNMGKKSPLRLAVIPPAGFNLFAIDSSNIEMRGQMDLAGESKVIERLRDPAFDLYSLFAAIIYDCRITEIDSHRRDVGKVAMLSLGFGSGAEKFHHTAWTWGVDITLEEALRIVLLYRRSFPQIKRAWDTCSRIMQMLVRGEEESTWFDHLARPVLNGPLGQPGIKLAETGLFITYPHLRKEYDDADGRYKFRYDTFDNKTRRLQRTDLYGAKMFQHIIQALCRNVVVAQSLAVDHFLRREVSWKCRTVMHIHDESIHLVPEKADQDKALQGALDIYATSPPFWPTLPTFGEAAYGDSYATAKP